MSGIHDSMKNCRLSSRSRLSIVTPLSDPQQSSQGDKTCCSTTASPSSPEAPASTASTTLLEAGVAPAFRRIALPDAFLDAGALPTLHDRYGISATAMTARIKHWLG